MIQNLRHRPQGTWLTRSLLTPSAKPHSSQAAPLAQANHMGAQSAPNQQEPLIPWSEFKDFKWSGGGGFGTEQEWNNMMNQIFYWAYKKSHAQQAAANSNGANDAPDPQNNMAGGMFGSSNGTTGTTGTVDGSDEEKRRLAEQWAGR